MQLGLRAFVFFVFLLFITLPVFATAAQKEADAICFEPGPCPYGTYCDPPKNTIKGVIGKSCPDVTNGKTTPGKCQSQFVCKATGAPGLTGGNVLDQGLQQLSKMLEGLLQKLMQGGQGGGQGGGQPQQPQTPQQGCTTMTPTNDQQAPASNPCLYYSPNVSDLLKGTGGTTGGSLSDLLNQLNNQDRKVSDSLTGKSVETGESISGQQSTTIGTSVGTGGTSDEEPQEEQKTIGDLLSGITGGTIANIFGSQQTTESKTPASGSQAIVQTVVQGVLPLGPYGEIKLLDNGTTILFGNRGQNTETSGFYGATTIGAPAQGVVARVCMSRPWASNFLSYVVPPSFFDSLCSWRGYQVGGAAQSQQPQVTVTQQSGTSQRKPAPKATTTVDTAPQSRVDIWAAPESVPLGARTSVFWNTENVTSCTETSPDGSFSHATLSGGASTVPITHDTIFTISCLKPDGTPITDSVTVRIAI